MTTTPKRLSALSVTTKLIVLCLALALCFEKTGALELLHMDGAANPENRIMSQAYWFSMLAPIFYLWGLWAASNVFARMDTGEAFSGAMAHGLQNVGGCLMIGAFCAIVVTPSLRFLTDTGFSRMSGAHFHFDIESLTIGLIGLALLLIAKQGRALKAELDQIV